MAMGYPKKWDYAMLEYRRDMSGEFLEGWKWQEKHSSFAPVKDDDMKDFMQKMGLPRDSDEIDLIRHLGDQGWELQGLTTRRWRIMSDAVTQLDKKSDEHQYYEAAYEVVLDIPNRWETTMMFRRRTDVGVAPPGR